MLPAPRPTPRRPSAFIAAVLSLLFPGLGQAYAGAWRRAVAWAAAPALLLVLGVAFVLGTDRFTLAGIAFQASFLTGVFVGNIVLLGYRLVAIVDAWWLVRRGNAAGSGASSTTSASTPVRHRAGWGPASLLSGAALALVLLVAAGAHIVIAHYDSLATSLADCVFDASGTADCPATAQSDAPDQSAGPGDSSEPTLSLPPEGTALPEATLPPWNSTDRLNILLVGVDQRPGGSTFNTDTLIVVSIDPTTDRVAMFSIPRDTVDIPLPPGPLQRAIGSVFPGKVNSIAAALRNRPDLCPGADATTRGFNCLKSILGYLYGLDIQYYAEVNFGGFVQVVDALGGVTIAVQSPVVDDRYPADGGGYERIFIPSGIQHMTGAQALIYARSRHGSNDFDRGARQQRVLISLLAETDVASILPRLDQLVGAFEKTIRTDVPREILPQLLGLAGKVDTKAIRSFVFAPPLYETEDYVPGVHDFIYPHVALIRSAVRTAFTSDPSFEAEREKVAEEGGTVWVLNGSGRPTEASDLSAYLNYLGFGATAPTQKPPKLLIGTEIVVYNGAEARLTETIAQLESIFNVTVKTKDDVSVPVDIVITTGTGSPDFTPPPLP